MAPKHGITISPGARIDFSALARVPTSPSLVARVTVTASSSRGLGIFFLILLILAGIALIFCAVVLILICKNKYKKKKRDREMEATRPAVLPLTSGGYARLDGDGEVQELAGHERAELGEGGYGTDRVQQLDGFVAAPKQSAQPIELPSEVRTVENGVKR